MRATIVCFNLESISLAISSKEGPCCTLDIGVDKGAGKLTSVLYLSISSNFFRIAEVGFSNPMRLAST